MADVNSYLSGYADGEGCFCVSFSKSQRHNLGREARPSFSVSQNSDRMEILELFKKQFGCGYIRPDRSDKTFKYEIRSIQHLIKKVIPHFEAYPLLSSKKADFKKFAEICRMISRKEHLKSRGFNKIVDLAFEMNVSGKRKYSKSEMKI
ncbi:MAG TPA: endonuclease [Actinobacteria bacterium]|nr:endonuclease [Actinomycetota bacterium]